MSKLRMKLNDTNFREEHDWLVLDEHNQFVTGFATSNAAERFIRDAEQESRIDQCVSRAERRRLDRLIPRAI
jgi:hypothetical protein